MTKKTKTWKPSLGAPLGPQEQRMYDYLTRHRISIGVGDLFVYVTGCGAAKRRPKLRRMHQKVGGVAARFNMKRKSMAIVPGERPNTYRLCRVR